MDLTGGFTHDHASTAVPSSVAPSCAAPSPATRPAVAASPAVPSLAVPAPVVPAQAAPSTVVPSPAAESQVASAPAVPAQGVPHPVVPSPAAGSAARRAGRGYERTAVGGGGGGRLRARPAVTELRLSAFAGHRSAVHPLGPVTLFAGPSGSGKSTTLRAYEALARLGAGDALDEVFPDAADCVPERARPDAQGRRGFRIGCTVDGPEGPVHLDLAVQAEPRLRIVGERLTGRGRTLLATALRDPGRSTVQAEWHTAGTTPVTRAPFPDDLLGTALLPLRVAGKTPGQLEVLAAAEQVVIGLRSAFACDPRPERMRAPVPPGEGRLRRGCGNLAEVLHRTHTE
ncbi:ATP-binding protein, partial [Streptomyces venezuelae]|uniref:ATP-binding protein n=1 Tax=Streptomyces venezuelae TaxID=54571 RepID=UPI00278C8EAA